MKLHKLLSCMVFFALFSSCTTKKEVDLIVLNAKIYTVDSAFQVVEAMAIKNGKIVDLGTNKQLKSAYKANDIKDIKGKTIVPGFIDAHCHFYGLGLLQQKVDVSGTNSFDEVIERIVAFQKEKNVSYITGRGWDQNNWEVKEFPTNEKLNKLFPNTPIAIRRIDGHALIANQKAIEMAGVTTKTKFSGGDIVQKNGKLTGVFIDNPMELIEKEVPPYTLTEKIQSLKDAEKICLSYGLTTVDDAGLSKRTIELIDSLQQASSLKIKVYAMVSDSPQNLDYYLTKGIIKTNKLNVRSIKVYGDGALGSRGAALKRPYTDKHNHYGTLLKSPEEYLKIAKRIAKSDYQMNTHAIGDSTNYLILKTYKEVLKGKKNRRWRIEHAQVIDKKDFHYFDNIIPSVQPTHATSDMYWAEERLGKERIKHAYAYKDLLKANGTVALGTDFPIEKVNPFLTFYAATARKDTKGFPKNGFQIQNALSREEALKGMTIWAAYSNFEENEKGSLQPGKAADFIVLDQNIMEIPFEKIPNTNVISTYIDGELVYEK